MVVMQLLAAEPDCDRRDVPALVFHLEVPIAERVADTVDDPCCPKWDPDHLHAPHDRSDEKTEQVQIRRKHDDDAEPVQRREQRALDPVIRRPLSILLELSLIHISEPTRLLSISYAVF